MKYNAVHCLFEQSGTFKNEFKKLGHASYDYDILNEFKETDFIIDLFDQIDKAYNHKPSIFDDIEQNSLIIAFFPCTRFSNQTYMIYQGTQSQLKNKNDYEKITVAKNTHFELSGMYEKFCEFYKICLRKKLKAIIENPYSKEHYLTRYFPIKPKIIDMDRRNRGDNFKKPTQYWFINCEPENTMIIEPLTYNKQKRISQTNNKTERSMINKEYAKRFIKEFIGE